MSYSKAVFENHLIAAMTSGIKQKGATYQLPETLALEYGRLCYNHAISEVIQYLYELGKRSPDSDLLMQDLADAVQLLVMKREDME